jgi:hypothetical protein
MPDEPLPSSRFVSDDTERRLYELMQYGFWTAAAGIGGALGCATLLYSFTALATLTVAGCAVGASLAVMLSVRLVRLHGLSNTRWQEWVFIAVSAGGVAVAVALLERVLP